MQRKARNKKAKLDRILNGIRNDPLGKYTNLSIDQAGRDEEAD